MKLTLLEIVQLTLASLGSDEVNSIFDTTESQQVALMAKTAYYDFAARANLPEHYELRELTATSDNDKPTLAFRPEDVRSVEWLKYNKTDTANSIDSNYQLITYLPPLQFFQILHSYDLTDSGVGEFTHEIGGDNIRFFYRNDVHPDYYTVYDDSTFVFNSFNSTEDSTIQKSKTLIHGLVGPTWTHEDSFTPLLDDQQFPLYINEVKVLAFSELKQVGHNVAAANSRRGWINMQKTKEMVQTSDFNMLPDFGRKGRGPQRTRVRFSDAW